MASNLTCVVENGNEQPVRIGQVEALAIQSNALVDLTVEYRTLIGEQRDMIRSMVEFTLFLMNRARETLAQADQVLERNNRAEMTVLDRTSPSHAMTAVRSFPVIRPSAKSPVYRSAAMAPPRSGRSPDYSPHTHFPATAGLRD